jgi:two-component system CheB/CheR fusion protein
MDQHAEPETARLRALYECAILDTPQEAGYDDIAKLAASICDAPIALVSLVDADRQWFKARVGMDLTQTPREIALCHYTIQSDAPLVVPNALADARFRDNPMVASEAGIRFYAGVPIRVEGIHRVGALCVKDTRPRELTPAQLTALATLADQVAAQLNLRMTIARLEAARTQLVATQLAAEEANRAKSLFLANMSHEIRTPLTAIIGFADLLSENRLSADEASDSLSTIRRSSGHLLSMVNEILDLSRIEAGDLRITTSPCDVRSIIDDAQRLVRESAEAKGLRLTISIDRMLPFRCETDPVRLRQIILNLLDNAVKFTPSGQVSLRASMPEEGRLQIEVEDTGIGIDTDQLERLFRPFEQGDGSTTRRFGGAGLGLAIGRRLARAMNGDLTAERTPGPGSRFVLTIAAPRVHAESPLPRVRHEPRSDSELPLASKRILIAEDGADNQRLLKIVLTRAGASLTLVEHGEAAVSASDAATGSGEPFDLIIMDMQMPVMDGYDATRTLRFKGVSTPILALTAHAMTGAKEECLNAGCTDYMSKPIDRHELVKLCRQLILDSAAALTPRAD